MSDSQRYPWILYLINNMEYIIFFQFSEKVFYMFTCSRNALATIVLKPQLKIIIFENYKHCLLSYSSDKAFNGTFLNWSWHFYEGIITFTVLFRKKEIFTIVDESMSYSLVHKSTFKNMKNYNIGLLWRDRRRFYRV